MHAMQRVMRASHTSVRSLCVGMVRPSSVVSSFAAAPSLARAAHTGQADRHKQIMGRSFTGIFAGKHIAFGNNVSHSERKTRRSWLPNVHRKEFYSQVLGKTLDIKVTTAALRTFDKYGGMDRYILRTPLHRLDEGRSRTLRTSMELALLNDPRLAHDLNLQDVLERLSRPSEVRRLRSIVVEAQDHARSVGHVHAAILRQRMPDGTVPTMPPLSEEALAQRQQWILEKQNAVYLRRAAHKAAGMDARTAARTMNGISIPKNVARQNVTIPTRTTTIRKRPTYEHPFTKPTKAPKAQVVTVRTA